MPGIHVHIPYKKLLDNINIARERKLDIEIYFDSTTLDNLSTKDLSSIKESLDWKPDLSIHGPFMDLSPGGVDEEIRKITVRRFLKIIEIARFLKPITIVFHPGYDRWRFNGHEDLWLENSLRTWNQVLENIGEIKALISIENVFEENPSTLESLINGINSQRFGFCFDTGHFNLFSKSPLKEWIDRLGTRLIEAHIHDNNGTKDEHLAIGDGRMDFDSLFKFLNGLPHKPLLTIEAHGKEAVLKSIERIKSFL